jgi:hypothetical protein
MVHNTPIKNKEVNGSTSCFVTTTSQQKQGQQNPIYLTVRSDDGTALCNSSFTSAHPLQTLPYQHIYPNAQADMPSFHFQHYFLEVLPTNISP